MKRDCFMIKSAYLTTASYIVESHFHFSHNSNRYIISNKVDNTEICHTLGYCGHPRSLANGGSHSTGTTQGHTATYYCNSGYSISGSSGSTCLSTGRWSGILPSCLRKYFLQALQFGNHLDLNRLLCIIGMTQ